MLSLPTLSPWQQQLAGNLPLLALIEFIDVRTKLHVLELSGSIPFWNWPVTPLGGRLLLSEKGKTDTCHLDRARCDAVLNCIDGRYSDQYHSASSATVKLCVARKVAELSVTNDSANLRLANVRKQNLSVIQITRRYPRSASRYGPQNRSLRQRFQTFVGAYAIRYWIVSVIGWLFWTVSTVLCIMGSLYVAAVYMLLMPLTGTLAHLAFGGPPRKLLNDEYSVHQRLVVVAEDFNGIDWLAFRGESPTVNSLLNKPLHHKGVHRSSVIILNLLRIAILSQWILVLASICIQDWNAMLVSFWIVFCASVSTYTYTPEESVQDWLQIHCGIIPRKISATFSSRRSMLSALIYLNPDRDPTGSCEWVNPILAPCQDRSAWAKALMSYIETGDCADEDKVKYWWRHIVEGVEMGKRIGCALQLDAALPV